MRSRILGMHIGMVLALAFAVPVAADTSPGGEPSDLGLESITVTSLTATRAATTAVVVIACSQDVETAQGSLYVQQRVGRFFVIGGDGWFEFGCAAGEDAVVTVPITSWNGQFGGGRATVDASAETIGACYWDEELQEDVCEYDFVSSSQTVRVKGGRT